MHGWLMSEAGVPRQHAQCISHSVTFRHFPVTQHVRNADGGAGRDFLQQKQFNEQCSFSCLWLLQLIQLSFYPVPRIVVPKV